MRRPRPNRPLSRQRPRCNHRPPKQWHKHQSATLDINAKWKRGLKMRFDDSVVSIKYHAHRGLDGLSEGKWHFFLVEILILCTCWGWWLSPGLCIGSVFKGAVQDAAHWKIRSTWNFTRSINCTNGFGLTLFNVSRAFGLCYYSRFQNWKHKENQYFQGFETINEILQSGLWSCFRSSWSSLLNFELEDFWEFSANSK